jgi:hypothetical protein
MHLLLSSLIVLAGSLTTQDKTPAKVVVTGKGLSFKLNNINNGKPQALLAVYLDEEPFLPVFLPPGMIKDLSEGTKYLHRALILEGRLVPADTVARQVSRRAKVALKAVKVTVVEPNGAFPEGSPALGHAQIEGETQPGKFKNGATLAFTNAGMPLIVTGPQGKGSPEVKGWVRVEGKVHFDEKGHFILWASKAEEIKAGE